MTPVGSVAAFIGRYVAAGAADPHAAATILAELDGEARLVIEAQRAPGSQRLAWLHERDNREWTAAQLAHAEQRAFVELRRVLQRRGLWLP